MGDRALVIFKSSEEVSPTCYLHWGGSEVPALLKKHKTLMATRTGDVEYAAARFVGIAHETTSGNTGLGIWNTADGIKEAVISGDEHTLDHHSHGDAGVIVVDVNSFDWKAYGDYLSRWVDGKDPEAEDDEAA